MLIATRKQTDFDFMYYNHCIHICSLTESILWNNLPTNKIKDPSIQCPMQFKIEDNEIRDEWLSWMTGLQLHPAIYNPANYLWKMQSMYPYM